MAATWDLPNKRRDASDGGRPMASVSTSSDQPPRGRTQGYPASWARTTSHRSRHTSHAAATSAAASGWLSAAATARCAMPTWHTTLVSPTSPTSAMIPAGPVTQPTRQPIMRSSLDAEPTVIVRAASAWCAAGDNAGFPSNRIRSIAASLITQTPCLFTGSAIASKCSQPSTAPVGITGLISSTAAVDGPIAAASSSGSVDQPSGPGTHRTCRGTPPASRMRLTRPAYTGSQMTTSWPGSTTASRTFRIPFSPPATDTHSVTGSQDRPVIALTCAAAAARRSRWPWNGR